MCTSRFPFVPVALTGLLLAGPACTEPTIARGQGGAATLAAVLLTVPAANADRAIDLPGLHNVVTYAKGLVGGGVPDGEAGFATLAAMGVKTVVSVDGAAPDIDLAHRHGLRYVHLPISYDDVPPARALELAQVVTHAPGPIYVHCHHGKHRSAAALAAAAIVAGRIGPELAANRMQVSGTAKDYRGLWAAVSRARPCDAEQLRADLSAFPEVARVSGMVALMAGIDLVHDQVKTAQASGWQVPQDHPDLVPAKATQQLHTLFATLRDDPESQAHDATYQQFLAKTLTATDGLYAAVRRGDAAAADAQFAVVGKACKQCHQPYRDQ